jgi:2-hydroxy-3-keto-5-methylthiopentenyl-1-phosphate phosphatase
LIKIVLMYYILSYVHVFIIGGYKMPKVLVCTDFDGTITNRAGLTTVRSPFYQSLLVKPENHKQGELIVDYRKPALKEDIQELFKAKFGNSVDYNKPDADLLMSPETVAFFHEALKSENVTVYILTKNRKDYIQALFTYQGFSPEEIKKLIIVDSGFKYNDLNDYLKFRLKNEDSPDILYILDDSAEDYKAMVLSATESNYSEKKIQSYNEKPGAFQWSKYQSEIRATLAAAPASEAPASAAPASEAPASAAPASAAPASEAPASAAPASAAPASKAPASKAPAASAAMASTSTHSAVQQFKEQIQKDKEKDKQDDKQSPTLGS